MKPENHQIKLKNNSILEPYHHQKDSVIAI